ncbi:MAG: DUF503 domain-containing protein [candidate division Zixibacteria bacterium]|nr:DUF503 domain-containing protein [candidate division Zixibacteria bacterium]
MIIGVCTLELNIPIAASLKDKRKVVRSVIARLRNEFNVAVAEVGHLDSWQSAIIAAVTVSGDRDYAHGLMTRVALWVEHSRLDCDLVDYEIELI